MNTILYAEGQQEDCPTRGACLLGQPPPRRRSLSHTDGACMQLVSLRIKKRDRVTKLPIPWWQQARLHPVMCTVLFFLANGATFQVKATVPNGAGPEIITGASNNVSYNQWEEVRPAVYLPAARAGAAAVSFGGQLFLGNTAPTPFLTNSAAVDVMLMFGGWRENASNYFGEGFMA